MDKKDKVSSIIAMIKNSDDGINQHIHTHQSTIIMGNRSSRSVDTTVQAESVLNGSNTDETVITQSGVFLANELQCK